MLYFYDPDFDWSLVHISGCYNFTSEKIMEQDFVEITGDNFVYNMQEFKKCKSKLFKLDVGKIDRHILMKKFTVNLNYLFLQDFDMQLYSSKYTFDVDKFASV